MHAKRFSITLAAALLAAGVSATAAEKVITPQIVNSSKTTIAVFGDWPYNTNLLNNANLLLDSINSDPDVKLVMHVGDIHSGSAPCTSADILPPIQTSVPGWNQQIYAIFQKFHAPVVYTPGDNEWTDCHKTKAGAAGDPLKELDSIRSLFFARPGHTLGLADREVFSQADYASVPADAAYVENLIWMDAKTVFVTLNLPGSNNDGLKWGTFENLEARKAEVKARTAADTRWLQAAFRLANKEKATGVVIGVQADMWDLSAVAAGGDGLNHYTTLVKELARLTLAFNKPVLLINGDSHVYGTDHPLANPTSLHGKIHNAAPTPNLTRVTVQGSTTKPAEWLKLTIDPSKSMPFSWVNVPFCIDPLGACQ
ncbi:MULTISPECIES: metallophosphoesterase [Methylosinus]|uniref:Calcineurin-like phosphoesterase domain-containing protein n=1 Tax=Methylosinus trichosporium (strain ATCC 35070 / NCIMB 11131 / UNIQEM 75 / OB3b) TaxID=595536 RepID=A0A2D2D5D3_METT3|nr:MULTISPECIES: metallophosphoesterase [Methylosinus]ATQ70237.1 hypothetical protein CQW49_05390 [Methylosinus trichosporium OB3b]OBS51652.1 hypothetical protein A8B73_15400 [Methylosinus sp. 3S-1]